MQKTGATYFDVQNFGGVPSLYVYPPTGGLGPTTFLIYGPGPAGQGSGGNLLLTTSLIVDMGFPRSPADAVQRGPSTDRRGRKVNFDD